MQHHLRRRVQVLSYRNYHLYPPVEQQELADLIPHAQLNLLKSTHGHDAFLIDMEVLNKLVISFRQI